MIDQDYQRKIINLDEYYRLRRIYGLPLLGVKACHVCGSANPEQAVQCFRCEEILLAAAAAITVKLTGITGPYAAQVLTFAVPVVLGRDPNSCNLVVPDQTGMISRKHADITFDSGKQAFILQDYSSNGTFIITNGERQKIGSWTLRPGERFCLANNEFSFEFNG